MEGCPSNVTVIYLSESRTTTFVTVFEKHQLIVGINSSTNTCTLENSRGKISRFDEEMWQGNTTT